MKDVTGDDYNIESHTKDFDSVLQELESSTEEFYVIANVGGHFVNVTGYEKTKDGYVLQYHETSEGKDYDKSDDGKQTAKVDNIEELKVLSKAKKEDKKK